MKNKGVPAAKDGLMHKIEQSFNKAQPKIAKTEILASTAYEFTQKILEAGSKSQTNPDTLLVVPAESAAALAKESYRLFKMGGRIHLLKAIISDPKNVRSLLYSILENWEGMRLEREFLANNPRASRSDLYHHLAQHAMVIDSEDPIDKQLRSIPWENKSILACLKPADWVEHRTSRNYVFHHGENDGVYYAQITCEQEENGCFFPIKVYSRAKNEDVSSQLVDTGKESTLERAKLEAENMMLCRMALDRKLEKKPRRKRSTA